MVRLTDLITKPVYIFVILEVVSLMYLWGS